MARYSAPQYSPFPFHITARCPNREPFPIPLHEVWRIMEDFLYLAHHKNGLCIHAFVLMPNHFHLIASTQEISIGTAMCQLLGETSKAINLRSHRINQNWGGRHYKCELNSHHYFMNAYKYVYQNPVRAGLCRQVEHWPHSTLGGLLGEQRLGIPLEPDHLLMPPQLTLWDSDVLTWLNTRISMEDYHSLKTALKKCTFKLSKVRERPNHLESDLA